MNAEGGAAAPPGAVAQPAPPLARRMACFLYEAMLLFGVALIPAVLGTLFLAQTGQSHPLQSESAVRSFALIVYGVYFVGYWSARGQTLAMQTWRIRVTDRAGRGLTQARALARYVACCLGWFAPAALLATVAHLPPWPKLAAMALGVAGYALLALAAPGRQFWHDIACGTRLVDTRGKT
ncbi:MAG: RDD family protein [Caldimonas sp.]